jgi:hypothetical protein
MHTRSLSLGTFAAAALIGCASAPRLENVEPELPPPMRVWIGYPIGSSLVFPIFVNREAYVAIFEIIPGRGASMVYPRSGADVFASDGHYADLSMVLGRSLYESDAFALASFQPRYYYAVASAAPLHLSRLLSSLVTMRRVLGPMYASYRPYDVIDRLTEYVVPKQPDWDWATDLFVDWPVPSAAVPTVFAHRDDQRLIACANGRIISVPRRYPYYGCPGDAAAAVAAIDSNRTVEMNADSAARPKLPKVRDIQRAADRRGGDVERRRRAEPGATRPVSRGIARGSSSSGWASSRTDPSRTDRYRDTRGESARDRATASRKAAASSERGDSREPPARGASGEPPARGESGERKPRR